MPSGGSARAGALAAIRWRGFDRAWVAGTLWRWARRRHAGERTPAAEHEVAMLRRCLARAPSALVRVLGGMLARRLEDTF